jgi:predicted MFS family arabinose efflux permease
MPSNVSERAIVSLVGAIQFVNILDFMMVMPLGPDFTAGLGIPASHLGFIGGSYTAAASVAGLAGAFFLERFDRRVALGAAMLGLVAGTVAGGFAVDLTTLLAARVIAGFFGGPATSISISIIADVVPPERRGKAMGAVMGAFAVASVLGVPVGLELARRGGWRMPFFAIGGVGLLVTALAFLLLPPMRQHLEAKKGAPETPLRELFRAPVLLSWTMTATLMMGTFALVPNISAYVQYNLGYPRERLGLLYLVGGAVNFGTTRASGWLVDKFGSFRVGSVGTIWFLAIVYASFYVRVPLVPVMAMFVGFMVANSLRSVPHNTLTSKVPGPRERARFMSIQSAVQHLAAALGAFLSAQILGELPDHKLEGMPTVTMITMALAALMPLLLWTVEARVTRASSAAAEARPAT